MAHAHEGFRFRMTTAGMACITFSLLCALCHFSCSEKTEPRKNIIRFVTWKPNQPAVWEEVIQIFEMENPAVSIIRETGPHSSTAFHDLLTQKLKNRSKDVDVFFMDVVWLSEFAAAGWAMALDDYFPGAERRRFLDSAISANTYNGHIYGVPLFIDSGILYYRKDLLEKYQYAVPDTWNALVDQAKTIVKGEAEEQFDMVGYSGQFKQYEGLVCNMMEFIFSNGGHIIDPVNGKAVLAETPAVEAVRFVRDQIIGTVASRGVLTYQEPESLDLFIQGRAVFHRNWPYAWQICNDAARSAVKGKVGVAMLPHFPGNKSCAALGGWQLGISRYSENKESAWRFVEFLSSDRVQKLFAVQSGKAPTRKALYDDPEVMGKTPYIEILKGAFLSAHPRPQSPLYPAISNVLQRYFSSAISSPDSDIEKQASDASREINRYVGYQNE